MGKTRYWQQNYVLPQPSMILVIVCEARVHWKVFCIKWAKRCQCKNLVSLLSQYINNNGVSNYRVCRKVYAAAPKRLPPRTVQWYPVISSLCARICMRLRTHLCVCVCVCVCVCMRVYALWAASSVMYCVRVSACGYMCVCACMVCMCVRTYTPTCMQTTNVTAMKVGCMDWKLDYLGKWNRQQSNCNYFFKDYLID